MGSIGRCVCGLLFGGFAITRVGLVRGRWLAGVSRTWAVKTAGGQFVFILFAFKGWFVRSLTEGRANSAPAAIGERIANAAAR